MTLIIVLRHCSEVIEVCDVFNLHFIEKNVLVNVSQVKEF